MPRKRSIEQLPTIALENEPQEIIPAVEQPEASPAERRETAEAAEQAVVEFEIAEVREKISRPRKKKKTPEESYHSENYGDFAEQRDENGKIILTEEQNAVIEEAIVKAKADDYWSPPSLLAGGKTATEYASRARNFSTRTRIVELPDKRRVFLINNYRLSWIHRELDAFGKWTAGAPMRKAKSHDWKRSYAGKSNIPTIENSDPNTITVPFIENVNADDAITFNHQIENFGAMPEIKNFGLEEKLDLSDRITDELAKVHGTGKAWGEAILANMIITKDGRPIIVDPETRFNENVPLNEQQAHDVADFIHSLVSGLRRSEKNIDIKAIIDRVIDRYPNKNVLAELPKIAKKKSKWYRKLLRPIHELPRLGQNGKDYEAVLKILRELA